MATMGNSNNYYSRACTCLWKGCPFLLDGSGGTCNCTCHDYSTGTTITGTGGLQYYSLANDYLTPGRIKNKKPMKLSQMMKKLLDGETKTLIKAGYINGDLDLTNEGMKALLTILFMGEGIKTELTVMAQEELDEADKKKK